MPIRRNSNFNDPAFAEAASNLASLFAPPSGSEAAGWAAANAKNAEAKRLAEFNALAADPNTSREVLDRRGIGAGLLDPTKTYHAVDQANETQRYGYDTQSKTSLQNNAADNTRALEDRRLQEEGALARLYGAPVSVAKDATVYLPNQTAAATGLPKTLSGLYSTNPGERILTPDGRTIDGQAKPLSTDEFNAQQQQRLQASGQLTDEDILNAVRGKEAPVQIVGQDGKPQYASPGAAVSSGAQPYIKDATVQTDNYRDPNGVVGTAYFDNDQKIWRDSQKGDPLAPGSVTSSKLPTDAVGSGFGKPTEGSERAGMFYNRAAPASSNIDAAVAGDPTQGVSGYVPSDVDYETAIGAMSGLPNAINRHFTSEEGRKFYGNATNFMMAVLRPDTGAMFGPEEFQSYARVFIPMPGDTPDIIQTKSVARATALSALQGVSRGADQQIAAILQQNGLPVPKEMAAVMARGGVGAETPPAAIGGAAPATSPRQPAQAASPERWDYVDGKLQRVK